MSPTIAPMTLGDIFDNTFKMIGRTFLRTAAIAVTFLIVPIILFGISANRFYSSMPDWGNQTSFQSPAILGSMFLHVSYFGAASLLFSASILLAEIAISIVIGGEMNAEHIGYPDAVRMTFDRRWLNGIGEGIIKLLIFAGAGFFASILVGVMAAAIGRGLFAGGALLILFTILLIILVVIFVFAIAVRLYFGITAIAIEGIGPIIGLKKSWFLVGGHWWRTLGVLILFFILSGFAVSIISVPIAFAGMFGTYRELFTTLGQNGGHIDASHLRNLQMGMGKMIGIGSGLSSFLSLLLTPAFTVVMYFDLRARHDDIPGIAPTAADSEVPVVSL